MSMTLPLRYRFAVGLFLLPADSHQRMADGLSAFFSPGHLWIETSLTQSDYLKRFGSSDQRSTHAMTFSL
jgi:hypothetical protein